MKLKKGDLFIALILAAAIISWYGINKLTEPEDGRQIVIEVNGDLYRRIPMHEGMKRQEIHINLENGKYIDIIADENGAYVRDVICPDKICQKTGLVNKVGQSIVCLPNKVLVYIDGNIKPEVDGISY
ncbi:MAG TPA: NusG domain II-containing protein [Bacillota bacterium]|nr:NusG domain II-containing protein [Bacillota bacterium]HOR85982.1 NusG domain II-containing protein [Bacillota bacterium]HPL54203.1 NusG domain II-containing protein [Bacillota bacterium]